MMPRPLLSSLSTLASVALLIGCDRSPDLLEASAPSEPVMGGVPAQPSVLAAGPAARSAVGSVSWSASADWREAGGASSMRLATYLLPGTGTGFQDGECVLFRFPGGGDPVSNIDRWIAQFSGPEGAPPHAERAERPVGGHQAWWLRVWGTWTTQDPPMQGPEVRLPDFGMFGVVIAGPGDPVFGRCTGPRAILQAQEPALESFFASVRVEE